MHGVYSYLKVEERAEHCRDFLPTHTPHHISVTTKGQHKYIILPITLSIP